jgi:hypothetical protein
VQAADPPPNSAKAKRALFIVITDYPGWAQFAATTSGSGYLDGVLRLA